MTRPETVDLDRRVRACAARHDVPHERLRARAALTDSLVVVTNFRVKLEQAAEGLRTST